MTTGRGLEGEEVPMLSVAEAMEILQAHRKAGEVTADEWERLLNFAVDGASEGQDKGNAGAYKYLSVDEVNEPLPTPVLAAEGTWGVLLAEGENMVLAGEGGTGKTSLVAMLALNLAALQNGHFGLLPCGFLRGRGGRVLVVSYEDRPSIIREKIVDLANTYATNGQWDGTNYVSPQEAVSRVFVINERPWEMYGQDTGAHIDTRPRKLDGWYRLWATIDEIEDLTLVIIDPALAAYTANGNSTPHIRQFLNAMADELKARRLANMIVHHSTKDSRWVGGMENYDEFDLFDPGKLQGASGWTDGMRGAALTMAGRGKDIRKLAVMKASWGEEWVVMDLDPMRLTHEDPMWNGMIIGFKNLCAWRSPVRPEGASKKAPKSTGPHKQGGGFQS